ncbi:acyltransferase family protein [Flavimobilis soli]|nr:acyltransferase [Flavimobilis soli]
MTSTRVPPPVTVTKPDRLAWPDVMRAACVCLVVVFHVELWVVETTGLPVVRDTSRWWDLAHGIMDRFLMPGLFLLSGLLVSRTLLTTGRIRIDAASVRRAVSSYYLYVVWLAVYWVVFAAAVAVRPSTTGYPHAFTSVSAALRQLVAPATSLWYLFALACYALVMIAMVRLRIPAAVVILAAGVLAVVIRGWEVWAAERIGFNFVFFVVGVYLAPYAAALGRLRWWWLFPAAAAFVLVTVAGTVADLTSSVFAVVARLATVPIVVVVCVLASRLAAVARVGGYVGRHTLSVYVLHPLLMIPLWWWATGDRVDAVAFTSNPAGLALLLYGGGAVVVALALLIETGLRRVGAGALFALPAALVPARARQADGAHR